MGQLAGRRPNSWRRSRGARLPCRPSLPALLAFSSLLLSPLLSVEVQIPGLDSGEWRGHLEEARTLVEAGEFSRAAVLLHRVVQFGRDRLVPLDAAGNEPEPELPAGNPADPGSLQRQILERRIRAARAASGRSRRVFVPAAEKARQMIAALPRAGLKAYGDLHERRARLDLESALERDELSLIDEVAELFAFTPSGTAARLHRADRLFVRGHFRKAARIWGELLAGPPELLQGSASSLAPAWQRPLSLPDAVRLKRLAALRILGEVSAYSSERARFVEAVRNQGGTDGLPPPAVAAGLERLKALEARIPMRSAVRAAHVPPAGEGAGNGVVHELPRLGGGEKEYALEWNNPWWAYRQGIAPHYRLYRGARTANVFNHFIFRPAFSQTDVFISGVFNLWKVDLETGSLRAQFTRPAIPQSALDFSERSESPLYQAVVDRGVVYRTVLARMVRLRHYMGYHITEDLPFRALTAHDADTGRVLWDTRGLSIGSSEDPKYISVLTPPLIRGERVYVGGVFQAGLFTGLLMALDRRTGEPVWQTQLASNQMELTMFGEPAREPFASNILEEEGILYYATQLGAVAALDARNGRILWLTTYDAIGITPTPGPLPVLRDVAWGPGSPLLVDGVLYVTPRDSLHLYAVDTGLRVDGPASPRTGAAPTGVSTGVPGPGADAGRILQSFANVGGRLRDLVGYRGGRLYLSGPDGIEVLDVAGVRSGGALRRVFSRLSRTGGEKITGTPIMVREGIVYASLTDIRLIDYDLKTAVTLTAEPFPASNYGDTHGNLSLWGSRIFVMSRHLISSFAPGAREKIRDL